MASGRRSPTSLTAAIDETAELLASNDDAFNVEDDQFNYNFGIEYTLTAGQKVYIRVGGYENDDYYTDYSYDLYVEKAG